MASVVYGPESLPASLTIGELKTRFQGDRPKNLLVKATYQPMSNVQTLAELGPDVVFLVQYKAVDPELVEEESVPEPPRKLLDWEKNLSAHLQEGQTVGPEEEYTLEKQIGLGTQAQVFSCRHRDGGHFAVKVYRKSVLFPQELDDEHSREYVNFKRELEALDGLRHQRIVKVLEVMETKLHFFIVMELGSEDLLTLVQRRGKLSEEESRHVFLQLLDGLSYMHSKGILHRDLKLDNIFIDAESEERDASPFISIKIGDFGLAKRVGVAIPAVLGPPQLTRATTEVGTECYSAPEVMDEQRVSSGGHYDKEVDYYSLGVCLYVLLTGNFPDLSKTGDGWCVEDGTSLCETDDLDLLPRDAKRLIVKLLWVEASQRYGLQECLDSDWIRSSSLSAIAIDPLPAVGLHEQLQPVYEDAEMDEG